MKPRFQVALIGPIAAAILLVAASARAIWPFTREPARPDPAVDLRGAAATLLSEAIRIPTINPPGDEEPLAALFVDLLRDHGVDARLIETPRNGSAVGRAAAWARLPGGGNRRPVVLLSHLDVVPAEPSEWLVAPYEGVVAGGYVVGRGALDAKGVSVVHLLALLELARRERPLERDVIFLATPDEETGGRAGAGFLTSDRPELLHDAEYLLTEGGGILTGEGAEPNVWGVAVSEKSPCWLRLVAKGDSGHGSTATDDAAIPRLVRALERVGELETELEVVPEVARMFESLAESAPPDDRFALRNLAFALSADPGFRARFLAVPTQNALVRNTLAVTVLEGGSRTNVIPARASAQIDARLLPGARCDEFAEALRESIPDRAVDLEILLSFEARSSPAETELFDAIDRVAAELDPGALVVPRVIAGFTDAHYFRELGIVSYGFVPRWLEPTESTAIHGPNERISIENLERGVRTLVRILEELDARPARGSGAVETGAK
jgi:acetylornithine deacetylase/succinyl-diaminopimelate desuccinylase-like protein